MYIITVVMCIYSLFSSYSTVSYYLDGAHGFKSTHALLFVFIGIVVIVCCIYNAIILFKGKPNTAAMVISLVIFALSVSFFVVTITLPGNVKTDFQYLILRIAQGFETTNIFLIITTAVGFIALLMRKFSYK